MDGYSHIVRKPTNLSAVAEDLPWASPPNALGNYFAASSVFFMYSRLLRAMVCGSGL